MPTVVYFQVKGYVDTLLAVLERNPETVCNMSGFSVSGLERFVRDNRRS